MDRDPAPPDAHHRSSTVWGGQRRFWTDTPLDRETPYGQGPPQTETPLDGDPSINRITDRCKNINFLQLRLLAVKTLVHIVLPSVIGLDMKRVK